MKVDRELHNWSVYSKSKSGQFPNLSMDENIKVNVNANFTDKIIIESEGISFA